MNLASQITIAAAILALTTGGWVRNTALSVGCITGGIACYQLRPRRQGLTSAEILELAIASSTLQAQEEIDSLEKSLTLKQQELSELDHLTSEELERLSQEKQQHIDNLNHQIEELTQLLEEQLAEIDAREEESRQRLREENEQHKAEIEAELNLKREQLARIAQSDEEWMAAETERLTNQLEQDKQIFLEEHQKECDRLKDRIAFLEQDLAAALWQLDQYEKPQLPEGVEQDQIAARRVIELLSKLGAVCDYRGSWLDTSYIYVRVRPRTGGEKEVKKHLNRIHIELNLAEPPKAETVPGAVQLYLRPRVFLPLEPQDSSPQQRFSPPPSPNSPLSHPEVPDTEAIATLNASYLQDFVEPEIKAHIFGTVSQLEVDWVNYLWNYHGPRPIRNQKAIIFRVWGKKSGDGSGFISARERLRKIATLLGIDLRRKGSE